MDNDGILGRRTITDERGDSVKVTLRLPEPDEHGGYYCEFSLDGLSWTGRARRAYGIDPIQAVYLALQSIGSDLEALQQSGGRDLRWEGASYLGFPTISLAAGGSG